MLLKKLRIVLVLFILVGMFSCESRSVSEDINAYCMCKSQIDQSTTQDDCNEIIEEIVLKYEYDPEVLIEIQQKLQECQ
jgi:hypothetical protein